jgi:hypothetical protein
MKKPVNTKSYSPLLSGDKDTKSATNNTALSITNHQPKQRALSTPPPNTSGGTTTQHKALTIQKPQDQTKKSKKPSSGRPVTSDQGGGKITRNSQEILTHSLTKVATTNTSSNTPPTGSDFMEIDEPENQ